MSIAAPSSTTCPDADTEDSARILDEAPDIETSSDAYAARFSGASGRYLLDMQARAVRAALPPLPRPSVLEVGGGHGQLMPLWADLGCELTVLVSHESCWQRVRRLGLARAARLVQGNLLELPFPDGAFDVVVAVRLMAHVERWPQLLSELCRVAGRSVLFDYPSKRGLNSLTPLLFGVKKSMEPDVRPYTSFSRKELEEVLEKVGYAIAMEHKQFFLPMALHRISGGRLAALERLARACALTRHFGSPVILRADRLNSGRGTRSSGDLRSHHARQLRPGPRHRRHRLHRRRIGQQAL